MSYSKTDSERLQPDVNMAGKLKKQIRLLVFGSSMTVAIAFGVSFYFGLVSNSSAVSTQFPELLPIVSKMKNLLIINTFAFSMIIIGSFYLLSILVTNRIFQPLLYLHKNIIHVSRDKFPQIEEPVGDQLFASMQRALAHMVETLRQRNAEEALRLHKSLEMLAEKNRDVETGRIIEEMAREKDSRSGIVRSSDSSEAPDDGAVFMQPV
ncbi:MAG: hypothetical protein JW814_12510 [Candidatus Krumholzibacteriota bacterium]|nr:hypothetical protein [Candidatus Krumholzibacteriota bacterium]